VSGAWPRRSADTDTLVDGANHECRAARDTAHMCNPATLIC
jgi:hypothetical protein